MPEYGFDPGQSSSTFAAPQSAPPPAPPPFLFELRPLSLGEILDRTFALYRQRFWLYCGISTVAAALATIGTFARLTYGLTSTRVRTMENGRAVLISVLISFATALLYFIAYSITQAATVSAVSAAYLGQPTSIAEALRTVRPHWFRYVLIALWQGWSVIWLFLLLALSAIPLLVIEGLHLQWLGGTLLVLAALSLVYGIIAYIRNSLGIVASVSERLTVRAAMRRSKQLVAGRKGRGFAILLLMYVLNLVGGVLQGVFVVFLSLSQSTAAHIALESMTLLMTFVTSSMVTPVGAIAFCLFYIDERVRKEGYDIEVLMERAGPAQSAPPSALDLFQ